MGAKNTSCFVPILFFLCFFINIYFSSGLDSISTYRSLSGDETIVSSGGNFELGFFKPGNFSKYYIGIWFRKISAHNVVWVANREKPITDKYSSELKVVDGNLVLFNEKHTEVWSTNTVKSSSGVVAVLLDEGNLVLRNGSSNRTIWQSWDHPSDTWLPGAHVYDKRANRKQILTSWKNSEDPAPGLYTYEFDQVGNQYLIRWNRSKQIWTSGGWNGKIFTNEPEMDPRFNLNFNFTYTSNTTSATLTYASTFDTRFVMDYSGQIKQFIWLAKEQKWSSIWSEPKTQCQVDAYCGAYGVCNEISSPFCNCFPGFKSRFEKSWASSDYSGGCERYMQLESGIASTTSRNADIFQSYSHMKWPDKPQAFSAVNAAGCKSKCLSNISCTAYAYYENACFTWNGDLFNMQQLSVDDNNGRVIYIRLHSSEFSKNNKRNVYGIVGGSIAIVFVLLGLLLFAFRGQRLWRATEIVRAAEGTLVAFGYKDLQTATKNFSEMLGRGGFGSVFKGTLPDSTVVAVKKLEGISQGEKQFRNEISTIGNIQHLNLVHLRGFCSKGNKKLLVYEYASNGSLNSHIFNAKNGANILPWKTRYEIAVGTARGLVYLHEKCRDCIIHCDIKPENILLDSYMCPKIADFGLAKLVGRDFSRVLTTMRGTRGYLAPEWISGAAITAKADVYSYGMMLFEFVSGRRNSEQTRDGKANFFPASAANVIINGGDILTILDPNLNQVADVEEVTTICKVACWCIQDDEHVRPTMSQIVQILEGVRDVDMPPDPRGLQVFIDNEDDDIIFFTDKPSSSNLHIQSNASWASSLVEEKYSNKKIQGLNIQE